MNPAHVLNHEVSRWNQTGREALDEASGKMWFRAERKA